MQLGFVELFLILTLIAISEACKDKMARFYWSSIYQNRKNVELCGLNKYGDSPGVAKRIFHGTESKPNQWPWLVSLRIQPNVIVTSEKRKTYTYEELLNETVHDNYTIGTYLEKLKRDGEITEAESEFILDTIYYLNNDKPAMETINTTHTFCGATLISDQWLLSVPHCFAKYPNTTLELGDPKYWYAIIGEHNQFKDDPTEVKVNISKIIHAPQINGSVHESITLLKLEHPVEINENVRPVCLNAPGSIAPNGSQCVVAGWGYMSLDKGHPNAPLYFESTLFDSKTCLEILRLYTLFFRMISFMGPEVICVESVKKSVSYGDSGGPVVCPGKDDGRWYLNGALAKFYTSRSTYPNIFSNVNAYLTWIHDEIARNQ